MTSARVTHLEGVVEEIAEALTEVGEESVWVAQNLQSEDERVEAKFKLRQVVRRDVTAQLLQRQHHCADVELRKSASHSGKRFYVEVK